MDAWACGTYRLSQVGRPVALRHRGYSPASHPDRTPRPLMIHQTDSPADNENHEEPKARCRVPPCMNSSVPVPFNFTEYLALAMRGCSQPVTAREST